MVSVRFPDFLFCDVFSDALEYLFGFCRSAGLKTSRNTALDIQITLELGISRNTVPSGRCTVCLWLLQRNAHLYAAWLGSNGAVQDENLVYLLPDGHYDADDLQNETIVCEC